METLEKFPTGVLLWLLWPTKRGPPHRSSCLFAIVGSSRTHTDTNLNNNQTHTHIKTSHPTHDGACIERMKGGSQSLRKKRGPASPAEISPCYNTLFGTMTCLKSARVLVLPSSVCSVLLLMGCTCFGLCTDFGYVHTKPCPKSMRLLVLPPSG